MLGGDFNGDGYVDLAVAYPFLCGGCGGFPSYLLYTLLGTGDGHFNLAGDGSVYGWPLAAADLNADGKLDVFTTGASYDGTDGYPESSDMLVYLAGVNEHAVLRIVGSKRWSVAHFLRTVQYLFEYRVTS